MKIKSAFCHVHTTVPMWPAIIHHVSPIGDHNDLKTVACSHPTCSRHFTRVDGYFVSIVGQSPEFGDMRQKLRCGSHHEIEFMVLTKINDELMWACPSEGCEITLPFRIHDESRCPHCASSAPQNFETARLFAALVQKDVELNCYNCDRKWKASEIERRNLGKLILASHCDWVAA